MQNQQLPQNINAEQSVLGAIFLNNDTFLDIITILSPDDFWLDAHKHLFKAFIAMSERGIPFDPETTAAMLQEMEMFDRIGGYAFVVSVSACVAISGNAVFYAKIVKDCAYRRAMINAALKISDAAYIGNQTVQEIQKEAEEEILNAYQTSAMETSGRIVSAAEIIPSTLMRLEQECSQAKRADAIPSGLLAIDSFDGGFIPSDLIIIAARTGQGKTALACQVSANAAELGHSVLYCCGEMKSRQIMARVLCTRSEFAKRLNRGANFKISEWDKVANYAQKIHQNDISFPFRMIDGRLGLGRICSTARSVYRNHGLKMLVVDYIQLVKVVGRQRNEEIGVITATLKELALELDISILALSQLNREIEKRDDPFPKLSDLKASGNIEEDADVVIFPYRGDSSKNDPDQKPRPVMELAYLIRAKNRDGDTGTAKVLWNRHVTRFYDIDRDHEGPI